MLYFNENCITGARNHLAANSIDLIITDPPYGIHGETFDQNYNRNSDLVIEGYVEVPAEEYDQFSREWILEAERVLKPGGSMYIISGYTNLRHILNALARSSLNEINHIIWKFNFGLWTTQKYVSSHYHILYYVKPGAKPKFNTYSRYHEKETDDFGKTKLNYKDREDVWNISREYKPGEVKNQNQLPTDLLIKMLQYSSDPGDIVLDMFLGSFSTAKVAIGMNRKATGFELNKTAYDYQIEQMKHIVPGYLIPELRQIPTLSELNNEPLEIW